METKFQTSFIPKKPITAQVTAPHHASTSIFMLIAVALFIASIGYAGASVWWGYQLVNNQEQYKKDLEASKNRFNPELIEKLKKANTKIDLAKGLLQNHLAVSEVFDIISRLTAENIRFNSFDLGTSADPKDGVKLTMRGVGTSFSAIAFQSDVFGQSARFGKNRILKDPVLSDLAVDGNGNVAFTFTGTLARTDLSYGKILDQTIKSEMTAGQPTQTGAGGTGSSTQQ